MKKSVLSISYSTCFALAMGSLLSGCAGDQGWKTAYEQQKTTTGQYEARLRSLETQKQQQQAPKQQQQRPLSLEELVYVCENLKHETTAHFTCATYNGEMAGMSFGFKNAKALDTYWDNVTETLGTPFCAQSNARSLDMYIAVFLLDTRMGRFYSCQTGKMDEWTHYPKAGKSA